MHPIIERISEDLDIPYDDVHDIILGNITEPRDIVQEVLALAETYQREVRVYTRETL